MLPVFFSPPLPAASPLISAKLPLVPVSPPLLFAYAVPLHALVAVLMLPPKNYTIRSVSMPNGEN